MLHCRFVGRVDFHRIMSAALELGQLLIGQILNQFEQFGIFTEEMFTNIGTAFDGIFLKFAVYDFAHALHQQTGLIAFQEGVPIAAPDDLDAIPASAAEGRLQLLDDLAVATHRAVQSLQVAIDDPDEVVELLARGQSDRSQRFRLIAFAVAEEGPDFLPRCLFQAAMLQVAIEPRLVNAHDRAETHRHRGKLPEIWHQPGVRIRRQTAAFPQFATEIVQLLLGESAFQKGAGIESRRGVALEIYQVRSLRMLRSLEEMVEANFV